MKFLNKKEGFTLLVASLIASLMLVVGLAIFNITFKEVQLTATSRDSQLAFFAADMGMECALFWDVTHTGFSDTVFATSSTYLGAASGSGIRCADILDISTVWITADPPYNHPPPTVDAATTTFTLTLDETCAKVTVAKFGLPSRTKIESRGRNTCDTAHPRRVERALRATY